MKEKKARLDVLFNPRSAAVFGASDNPAKLGFYVMSSLNGCGFRGPVYPINPGQSEVLGRPAYPDLEQIPGPVDLAVVCVPGRHLPEIIRQCSAKGVQGLVVISSGFGEIEDPAGAGRQAEITELADQAGLPIIGPNTFGFVNAHLALNATFCPEFLQADSPWVGLPGHAALVSQSGGVAGIVVNRAYQENVRFSKVIGLGNRCNVGFPEILEYLDHDEQTKVVCLYMEGAGRPGRLLDFARSRTKGKPVLVYKAGHWSRSDQASKSHTGTMAGRHEIYQGLFRQMGFVAVNSCEELLDAAKVFSLAVKPQGRSAAVLSAQAGPALAASDFLEAGGLAIPAFSGSTRKTIEELLPPLSLRSNPVDLAFAWYDLGLTQKIIETLVQDPDIGSIMFMAVYGSANIGVVKTVTPVLLDAARVKPVVTCLSAPFGIWDEDIAVLEEGGAPNYPTPERAARALVNLVDYYC